MRKYWPQPRSRLSGLRRNIGLDLDLGLVTLFLASTFSPRPWPRQKHCPRPHGRSQGQKFGLEPEPTPIFGLKAEAVFSGYVYRGAESIVTYHLTLAPTSVREVLTEGCWHSVTWRDKTTNIIVREKQSLADARVVNIAYWRRRRRRGRKRTRRKTSRFPI